HLVLSTLHTLDATETVNRIVSVFPPHQQKGVRIQLASVLRGVISMRLVRAASAKYGRVPAVEVMINTPYIRDCIIHPEKTSLIRDAIAAGTSQYNMQTFDQSLHQLFGEELITYDEALNGASNIDEFKLRLSGIRSAADLAREDMERSLTSRSGDAVGPTEPEIESFGR
ncbi:MAG: type IV pili twitching motility protein PilT, partial [Acidobacteria bacterium]|nr:type IV pili twitching motility protein PilT [Acidobacteriota bacterium]